MKKTNVTALILILVVLTLLLSMASSALAHEKPDKEAAIAAAQAKQRDWILRFGLVAAQTNGRTSVEVEPGSLDVRFGAGGGGFANIEYKVLPFLGLEFGSTTIGSDLNVSTHADTKHVTTDVDVLGMNSLTIAPNFHFVRTPTVSLYGGPILAFNRYAKWSVQTGVDDDWWPEKHDDCCWASVRSESDSEVTWGAKLGVDIVLTKRGNWALSGSISYLDATYTFSQPDGSGRGSVDFDPFMFSFGGGFRF